MPTDAPDDPCERQRAAFVRANAEYEAAHEEIRKITLVDVREGKRLPKIDTGAAMLARKRLVAAKKDLDEKQAILMACQAMNGQA
jgi:hypothetical protein